MASFTSAAAYEGGDIELRFRDPQQKPLRADSVLLKMASPTVLAPMIDAESPAASYLLYNFSKLLVQTNLLLKSEEAWAKGTKRLGNSFGQWLWLAEELQMVSLHTTLATLLQGMKSPEDTDRLFAIGREVNAAAGAKKQASALGVLMWQFDCIGVQKINEASQNEVGDGMQEF
eukprot:gene7440-578_t